MKPAPQCFDLLIRVFGGLPACEENLAQQVICTSALIEKTNFAPT